MHPYSPSTQIARVISINDVHHKTADQPRRDRRAAAKILRHAARQFKAKQIDMGLREMEAMYSCDWSNFNGACTRG